MSDKPLSPRHERFVLEYLKDGNATRAYLRAGYSPRGAQPSASRLLCKPNIEAAIAAGRQRIAQSLEVTAERIALEYAKIAFASVDDFVSTDADGRLRIDLDKACQAKRAGIVELKVTDHRKGEQTVILKLGKLRALDSLARQMGMFVKKPAPGLTAEDRAQLEERNAALRQMEAAARCEQDRLQRELDAARSALAEAQVKIDQARYAAPEEDEPSLWMDEDESPWLDEDEESPPTEEPEKPRSPVVPRPVPTEKPPGHMTGFYLNGRFVRTGEPKPGGPANPTEALRLIANHSNLR